MKKIKVNLNRKISASYEIFLGRDILDRAGIIIQRNNWARRWFVVSDQTVAALYGGKVQGALAGMGLDVETLSFPPGEARKTMETALALIEGLLNAGADRSSGLIALGGGVTGDLAGFTASIFMRGIPYIQVPTTLVGQVDSSIGGKTGVDLREGKNLAGTFYQPKAVIIDMAFLQSLPDGEFRSGLAEVAKYGIIDDPGLFEYLEFESERILAREMECLAEVVSRSCSIKKGIVEIDEKELGIRKILNYGHTLGHAVEAESAFAVSHGDAVAMGMIAAAKISEKSGYLPEKDRQRIEELLRSLGLQDRIPDAVTAEGILSRIRYDKKKKGREVSFVLLKRIGVPFSNGAVDEKMILEVIEEMRRK